PADMYIYSYSLLDLIGTPQQRHEHLDETSVRGFMGARGYITDQAMSVQQDMLVKAFACPSFLTAANTFRKFLSYSFQCPSPMMWLLGGNTQECLIRPLERHLRQIARRTGRTLDIQPLRQVIKLLLDDRGTVVRLECGELASSPSVDRSPPQIKRTFRLPVHGDVILAVPPQAVASLLDDAVYQHAPKLGDVRKLRSEPMISMDLYFKVKLPDLPLAIVNLQDSKFDLSFLDTSQAWATGGKSGNTVLNVVASDVEPIVCLSYKKIAELLIEHLNHYIPFSRARDIDHARTYVQTNLREALFTNEVGSAKLRPTTRTGIANLFMAGDYVTNPIDVVTIEGAVASGLSAAEAVRQRAGIGEPITVTRPTTIPEAALLPLRLAGAPSAYAAKAMSVSQHWFREAFREVFPRG
ncbi:MAG TPA: FAD-dependent oxidoreductase, partial [Tepidisphaeraceae bacterium]|nr:FAD-dependent oxidoreductase [Tepidisphaeraceae bacterium]